MAKASAPRRSSTRLAARAAVSSDAPLSRAFHLPPEILELVLAQAFAAGSEITHEEFSWRNGQLAALALVSRAWRGPVYAELYGDLRVTWLAGNVDKLFESFANNADLLLLVRRFEAFGILASSVLEERVEESLMAIEEEGTSALRCAGRNHYDAENEWNASSAGQRYRDPSAPGWLELVAAETKSMRAAGHFAWTSRTADLWGFEEFLDLVEGATNLRFLAVHGFAYDLPDHLLHRGPFGFKSFDSGDHGPSPFVLDIPRFVSFLAARAPALRHLATTAPHEDDLVDELSTPLPALISLRLDTAYKDTLPPTVIAALELLQPSLRTLTFSNYGAVKWGAALAPFLSTLETLDISVSEFEQSENVPSQIIAISPAIAQSSSLRHLRVELTFAFTFMGPRANYRTTPWLPEQLLSSLPSSLVSLTLAPFCSGKLGAAGDSDYFTRMLAALNKSSPRPLRVVMRSQSKECDGLPDIVEEYRQEGIELVI